MEAAEIVPVEVAEIADVDQVQKVVVEVHPEGREEEGRPWSGVPQKEVVAHLHRNAVAVDLDAVEEELRMQGEAAPLLEVPVEAV